MAPQSFDHLTSAYPERHVDRESYTTGRLDCLPAGKHSNVDRATGGYVKPKHERTTPVPAFTPAAPRGGANPGMRPAGIVSNPPEPTLSWQDAELVKEFDRDHQQRKGESNAARNLQAITRGKQVRDQRTSPAAAFSELG
jgi:hypothetical protein